MQKMITAYYSKVCSKGPILLNDLVWIFPKSLYQTTKSISKKIIVQFYFRATMGNFWSLLFRQPALDIWKKSLSNIQHYPFFQILEA